MNNDIQSLLDQISNLNLQNSYLNETLKLERTILNETSDKLIKVEDIINNYKQSIDVRNNLINELNNQIESLNIINEKDSTINSQNLVLYKKLNPPKLY